MFVIDKYYHIVIGIGMRASEFITENNAYKVIDAVSKAQQYLSRMFKNGIADRSAVMSVIDVLHRAGLSHVDAANATKKAFVNLKGSEVTTEGLFD